MGVITISRQLGAHGTHIAGQVAEKLGYSFVDKSVIEKIITEYGFSEFEQAYEEKPNFWRSLDERRQSTISFLKTVLFGIGQRGKVVLLGRGSFGVFPNFTNVLNVRVHAPLDYRAKRVMARRGMKSIEDAKHLVEENDRSRNAFIKTYFNLSFDDAYSFDLVLNTAKFSPERAVDFIVNTQQEMLQRPNSENTSTHDIEIDPLLMKTIDSTLGS